MIAIAAAMPESARLSLISVLVRGFVLGMRHATDADHVVAVSTIISRERHLRSAAWIGALWGAGHTLTIMAVGIGIIVFTLVIPPRVGLSMEFSVGVMLVLLGLLNLRTLTKGWPPRSSASENLPENAHSHAQADEHVHLLSQRSLATIDRRFRRWTLYQWLRPFVVGLVHGLAGSAAVALLVLATLHDARWAVAYLFLFGVGTKRRNDDHYFGNVLCAALCRLPVTVDQQAALTDDRHLKRALRSI
jgi:high-affinity nickel permease